MTGAEPGAAGPSVRGAASLVLFVVLVAGLACAPSAAYIKVVDVTIDGNRAIGDGPILAGLATRGARGLLVKEYAEYDEVALAKDRQRIVSFYQREGYFSASVEDVLTRTTGESSVEVTFRVVEGEPTRIESVEVIGLPDGVAPAAGLVLVGKGDVYRQESYTTTKGNLVAFLARRGYAHAKITGAVEIDRDLRRARVRLLVDPGPLVAFGDLEVKGRARVPESAVRARVAWDEGARYDPALVEITRARLYQLALFSSVVIEPAGEGRPAVLPMVIGVREGPRHELKLGAGLALDNSNFLIRPRAGYLIKGAVDPLLVLDLEARPGIIISGPGGAGELAGEVSASLRRDDLFYPRLRGTASVTLAVTELETYSARGLTGGIALDRPFLHDHLLLGIGYSMRWLDFTRVSAAITPADRATAGIPDEDAVSGFAPNYRLGVVEQSASFDLRDNPLDARRGLYVELRTEGAARLTGSQYGFVKMTPEVRLYLSPLSWMVVAGRVRAGATVAGALPITQRFFSGGGSSQRGFTYRRLSPMSSGEGHPVPLGGTTLVEGSVEVRFDILELLGNWLGLAVFLDAGDVTSRASDLDLTALHLAAGGGLRFNTLVGPIRFDVGYRLNRHGAGEPDPGERVAFHLSVGQAF